MTNKSHAIAIIMIIEAGGVHPDVNQQPGTMRKRPLPPMARRGVFFRMAPFQSHRYGRVVLRRDDR